MNTIHVERHQSTMQFSIFFTSSSPLSHGSLWVSWGVTIKLRVLHRKRMVNRVTCYPPSIPYNAIVAKRVKVLFIDIILLKKMAYIFLLHIVSL